MGILFLDVEILEAAEDGFKGAEYDERESASGYEMRDERMNGISKTNDPRDLWIGLDPRDVREIPLRQRSWVP